MGKKQTVWSAGTVVLCCVLSTSCLWKHAAEPLVASRDGVSFLEIFLASQKAQRELNALPRQDAEARAIKPEAFQSSEYPLGPGDEIELVYRFANEQPTDQYRLRLKDQIGLTFVGAPTYNRTVQVRSDGRIDLPMAGELQAAGRTLPELEAEIRKRYATLLAEPEIHAHVVSYVTPADELKEAVWSSFNGYTRTMVVRPDGCIAVPLLNDVQAAGRTPSELQKDIETGYAKAGILNVNVTVVVRAARSAIAYVLGEVPRQGPLPLRGPIDVWRAVAEAGGFGKDADRRRVHVVKSTPEGEKRLVLNFDAWRIRLDDKENATIGPGDIIYVPKATNRYVYIAGEVESPGRVELDADSELTVSQAVWIGGGITSRGQQDQVLLLRSTPDNQPLVVPVSLKAIYARNRAKTAEEEQKDVLTTDPLVQPGDIVYVPRSGVGDFNRFAEQWFRNGIWTVLPFTAYAGYQKGSFNTNAP